MGKWQQTHQKIIVEAAPLFNQRGYSGTSIGDIMEATKLKKGGIYSHFKNKESIALASFDYAFDLMHERYKQFLAQADDTCVDKLLAVIRAFATVVQNPPVAGGCAILNTAVESDDTHPLLKQKARYAMDIWISLFKSIIDQGIRKQEIRKNIDSEEVATIMIINLEGAMVLSKLCDDSRHMDCAVAHLQAYIAGNLVV